MLDVNFIRENPELVKANVKRRNKPELVGYVDEFLKVDKEWRALKQESDSLRQRRNTISAEINSAKKAGKDIHHLVKEAAEIPGKVKLADEELAKQEAKMNWFLLRIPNLLHEKVPLGKDANDNPVVKKWGTPKKQDFEVVNHAELMERLGLADFDAGRENAGKGFNYIKGKLARLDLALQRYGIDFLIKKGFTVVVPPLMLNRETLGGAVDLSAFEEVIYKIEGEDLYMIGTAEHSLVTMMKNKSIPKENLPLRVCAITPAFRKEIGGHGVDTKGLYRMHQFNKVEQVVFAEPEKSWEMFEEMGKISEEFWKSLEIPFRVIEICSGDLGGKFAKQYDIEAWFPRQAAFGEVGSDGNCTDYQARALNISTPAADGKRFVHILNNTMVATSRAMVVILENFQNSDGSVDIPKALWKYTGFKKIP